MTDDIAFERLARDWLEIGPVDAPDRVVGAALLAIDTTSQERDLRIPWRFPDMPMTLRVAAAAVVIAVLGGGALMILRPAANDGGIGGTPTPSPSPSPSPTAAPSMPPPLSGTFTSSRNGISIDYPAGWATQAATQPWTTSFWPPFRDPAGDFMYDESVAGHLFIALASKPLSGTAGDQWAADTVALDDCAPSEPVTIDGASGRVSFECNVAAVALDGRGYVIVLYASGDEPWLDEMYDRAWFEQLLTTIDLRPEDAASASPSPAQ
jgi:hypothetical protein